VPVAVVDNSTVWLTAEETAELLGSRQRLIDVTLRRTAAEHPAGARRVRALSVVVPLDFE